MHDVRQPDCLAAWQEGVKLLRANHGEIFNLITVIESPETLVAQWLVDYSPQSAHPDADDIRDVIDTVFPYKLQARFSPRKRLFLEYLRRNDRAMKWRRNRGRWGTYFSRLINFSGTRNQLDITIEKIKKWKRSTTGLVFHLSAPTLDSPRTRGGPCWQYAEILWKKGDVLDLVVVYRNHDFFNKAFGNFIAQGQLLRFIAAESGKTTGHLICHSVHAYSERPIGLLTKLAKV